MDPSSGGGGGGSGGIACPVFKYPMKIKQFGLSE